MATAWSGVSVLLGGLWQLTGHALLIPSGLPALAVTLLAAAALAAVLMACLVMAAGLGRPPGTVPLARRTVALREKAWGAAFLRLRDPDAAGRARPRAPSAAPAAASS